MEKYPEHVMLGEEGISWGGDLAAIEARKDKEWMWVVDPVDGTTNFVSSCRSVSIGVGSRLALFCDLHRRRSARMSSRWSYSIPRRNE